MQQAKTDILATLKKWWGYDDFRAGQREVIEQVCAGHDTLALMPTGAGKSLLYQVPTMAREGLCVVITPLVALMKDQVDSLRRRGINAVAVHSGLSPRQIDIALDNCVYGDVKFLYVAPERLATEMFRARVSKMKVSLLAVDEAHCISQWGYDFRPSYLRIAEIRRLVPEATVLALTASATPQVAEDVMRQLAFGEENIVRSDFSRPNISFAVRHTDDKREQLRRVLDNVEGSAIVYMRTREGCEKVCEYLREQGYSADYYHAGLAHTERALRQDEWQCGQVRIMVATNAFGMGIDKDNVRAVVHYDMCDSLEAYYQEAGRAGRDGRRSYAVLLVGSDEKDKVRRRIESDFPPIEVVKRVYNDICSYLMVGYGEGKGASFQFDIYDFCAKHNLQVVAVRNCIKLLAQNGYMFLGDDGENSARLMFCISRDDLYDYRVRTAEMDSVLRAILRLYEGVFTSLRPIDVQEIALHSSLGEQQVLELLKILWRSHVIRYVPRSFTPLISLWSERIPERDVYINPATYHMRRDAATERLEAMLHYAYSDECRSEFIQRYFGQTDAKACGACDCCIALRKGRRTMAEGDVETPVAPTDQAVIAHRNGVRTMAEGTSSLLTSPTDQAVIKIISSGEFSVRDVVRNFASSPDEVVDILDSLTEGGKIYVDRGGILRIK